MTGKSALQIVLASRPKGQVVPSDFRLEETKVPSLESGQILLGVAYLSLDPYMRGRMEDRKSYGEPTRLGEVMPGESVSVVISSEHPNYCVGDVVLAPTGWRTYALSDGIGLRRVDPLLAPVTTRLGVLGMPGFTAYAGLKAIGKPAEGETVVVAAATGPVGSLVGQLAKIAGARVVGIAGGPEKRAFAISDLGFDACVDHRIPQFASSLAASCPSGIDIYFESVGGLVWQAVLPLVNKFGRVPLCGLVSQYGDIEMSTPSGELAATMRTILSMSLTVR